MRWINGLVLVVLVVAFGFLPHAALGQSVTAMLNRAVDLYYDGRYQEAIAELERAVRAQPSNPTVHLWLGVVYADSGLDPQKAVDALRRVLTLAPPGSPEAAQAQRWLLRLQGRPRSLVIGFSALDARYDRILVYIVDAMIRQINAEGAYSHEVMRGPAGGRDALLTLARNKGAGWALMGVLRQVGVSPSLFERGVYCASIRLEVALIDAALRTDMPAFEAGEGTCDPSTNRALDVAVSRTGSGIWPKVANLIRVADERVREELNRVSIRLQVPNVYAYAARMDRRTANALPLAVVPAFRGGMGTSTEVCDDATEIFTRHLIATSRYAVVPEPELIKHLRTRGDAADPEALLQASRQLRTRYLLVGEVTRAEVKSNFALIGTNIEVDSVIRIRVMSADGAIVGEATVTRKRSRIVALRTEGQVRDQATLFRTEVFTEMARELVDRVENIISPGSRPTPPPSPPAAPVPVPSPTEREGR